MRIVPLLTLVLACAAPAWAHDDCARHDPCHDSRARSHQDCHHGGGCLGAEYCCHPANCRSDRCEHPDHLDRLDLARIEAELDARLARRANAQAKAAEREVARSRRLAWQYRDRANYTNSKHDWRRVERIEAWIPQAEAQEAQFAAKAREARAKAADSAAALEVLEESWPRRRARWVSRCSCS